MQYPVVIFTFSIFDWKYLSWTNLVQKIKIVSLNWNLVPRLVGICRIQWHCSLFLFKTGNTLFEQIWSKKSKLLVYAEIWYRLIRICRIQWWCSLFLIYTRNTVFRKRRQAKSNYCPCDLTGVETLKYTLFYKHHFYKQRQAEIGKKSSKC